MGVFLPEKEQDSVNISLGHSKDSVRIKNDSVDRPVHKRGTAVKISANTITTEKDSLSTSTRNDSVFADTICSRNKIVDVTFYDSTNFISLIKVPASDRVLVSLAETSRIRQEEQRQFLEKRLREGENLPSRQFHGDWIILIVISTAFLFSLIRQDLKKNQPFLKLLNFRANDSGSRDATGLFHWQSTIMNLVSFMIIGLFGYDVAEYFTLVPSGLPGIAVWAIILAMIIIVFTMRNAVCAVTGNVSGRRDIFNEYLAAIYQSYHLGALILFFLVVVISYTTILSTGIYVIAGFITIGLMYILRIIRLFTIFINRNISIFYLILYLCALEILPVAITIRYITGLA